MNQRSTLDVHVHMVGTGAHGSGCHLNLRSLQHRLLARLMIRSLGFKHSVLMEDLEEIYLSHLIRWIDEGELNSIVLLANDHTYDETGRAVSGFGSLFIPNEVVLAAKQRDPRLSPGVSIHPARGDAIEELHRCAAAGAVLVKLLPNCHNVDCGRPQYLRFWQTMADLKLLLRAHTGGELALPVYNPAYANPALLRAPLESGVTVIAAHCGTSSHRFDPDYFTIFQKMIGEHPNLYGDNSGLLTPFRSRHLRRLLEPEIQARIVHGSDLPIPSSPLWCRLRGLLSAIESKKLSKITNPLLRDAATKRAIGFNEITFSRFRDLRGGEAG